VPAPMPAAFTAPDWLRHGSEPAQHPPEFGPTVEPLFARHTRQSGQFPAVAPDGTHRPPALGKPAAAPGWPPDGGVGPATVPPGVERPPWLTDVPAGQPGGAPGGGPQGFGTPVPPASGAPTRTASGLVKRTPRAGTPDAAAAAGPSGDLLASLSRVTGNQTTGEHAAIPTRGLAGPPPTAHPTVLPPTFPPRAPGADGGGPAAPSGVPPAPPLTRRVRGAQLPTTEPLLVRRGSQDAAARARPDMGPGPSLSAEPRLPPHVQQQLQHLRPVPTPSQASASPGGMSGELRRSANDVYSFLSSFTAGVQRGLDEARPPGERGGPSART
jgi:hypothetical protein